MFEISVESNESFARVGKLKTAHGKIKTPFFMPVVTKASAKLISQKDLEEIGVDAVIANAFLLALKPGTDLVKEAGGLHEFMNWKKGIFTDSGGFQILNKDFLLKNSHKGVWFRNPFNGEKRLITPEETVRIQNELNSDVAMVLDDVPHYGKNYKYFASSAKKTKDWAKRCKKAHANDKQLLFGIAQGGIFKDLRAKNIADIRALDFDGLALGGLCIGEPLEKMYEIVKFCTPIMPKNKVRYLMGVGGPEMILECISLGVDSFDSCFPTRMGRHGVAFTAQGKINLKAARYTTDFTPLDADCKCFVCQKHSRAYLKHLFKAKEFNGAMLVSYHNIYFIQKLIEKVRKAIKNNELLAFKKEFLEKYKSNQQQ